MREKALAAKKLLCPGMVANIEHQYSQYHEEDAWLRESGKASSGNFFKGVKASSDEHSLD